MADRKQGVNAVLHALATPVRHKLFGGSWAHGKEEHRLLRSEQLMGADLSSSWEQVQRECGTRYGNHGQTSKIASAGLAAAYGLAGDMLKRHVHALQMMFVQNERLMGNPLFPN